MNPRRQMNIRHSTLNGCALYCNPTRLPTVNVTWLAKLTLADLLSMIRGEVSRAFARILLVIAERPRPRAAVVFAHIETLIALLSMRCAVVPSAAVKVDIITTPTSIKVSRFALISEFVPDVVAASTCSPRPVIVLSNVCVEPVSCVSQYFLLWAAISFVHFLPF